MSASKSVNDILELAKNIETEARNSSNVVIDNIINLKKKQKQLTSSTTELINDSRAGNESDSETEVFLRKAQLLKQERVDLIHINKKRLVKAADLNRFNSSTKNRL